MAEEAEPQPFALGSTLDDPGDVCHNEGATIAVLHDAEVGYQRREGVIGHLGFGGGDSR